MLQEALNNVGPAFGSASRPRSGLRSLPDSVTLEVEDHGAGFSDRGARWPGTGLDAGAGGDGGRAHRISGRRAAAARWCASPFRCRRRRCMPRPDTEDAISVMLVDDHLLVRRGFRRMLEDDPDIDVVARGRRRTGSRSTSALRAAARCRRDGLRAAQHEWRGGHAQDSGRARRIPPS